MLPVSPSPTLPLSLVIKKHKLFSKAGRLTVLSAHDQTPPALPPQPSGAFQNDRETAVLPEAPLISGMGRVLQLRTSTSPPPHGLQAVKKGQINTTNTNTSHANERTI